MAFSDALAILGAATGVTGTTLGVVAFVRDRARLYVRLDVLFPGERNAGVAPRATPASVTALLDARNMAWTTSSP